MIKRCLDIFLASCGIVLLSPLWLSAALIVKLGDGGSIFFRQERVGRHGRLFRIWKFRTMRQGADRAGPSITKSNDSRITGVGALLRHTKFDELPQLLNVLVGEMSFVGPRPEVPRYVAMYTPAQKAVLDLRPGITDLASIEFRNEEEMLARADDAERFYVEYCIPKKIELNLLYAATATIFSDLKIIFLTFLAVMRNTKNASGPVP